MPIYEPPIKVYLYPSFRCLYIILRRFSPWITNQTFNKETNNKEDDNPLLLLLYDKLERPKREHKGKIAVAEIDMRLCSDDFGFGCDNGGKLRATFALNCCDREALDWRQAHARLRKFNGAGCDAEVSAKALRRPVAGHTSATAHR